MSNNSANAEATQQNLDNPYLSGNFAPIKTEISSPCKDITGSVPTDLNGSFLRVGPNQKFGPRKPDAYHWFDGDGMIHQLQFNKGELSFGNRWVETQGLHIENQKGEALWDGLNSLPDFNNEHGLMFKNVANTALVWHAKRLLALWEAGSAHEISLPDLSTQKEETFAGKWTEPLT